MAKFVEKTTRLIQVFPFPYKVGLENTKDHVVSPAMAPSTIFP